MKDFMTAATQDAPTQDAPRIHTRIIIAPTNPAFHESMRRILQHLYPDSEIIVTALDGAPGQGWHDAAGMDDAASPAVPDQGDPPGLARLSARQRDVLDLVVDGETNKAIARRLGISPSTVRVHVSALLRTLGVTSRTAAAAMAARRSSPGRS